MEYGKRAGLRTEWIRPLEAVQRCKSERSSCAKVQRWCDGVAGGTLARGPVGKGRYESIEYGVLSID